MLIVLVAMLGIMVLALAGVVAILWRRMRYIEVDMAAQEKDFDALEGWVVEALDDLDAEVGAAADAERIIERATRGRREGKVFLVPVSRWVRKHGQDKRITGVLLALTILGSAAVVTHVTDKPDDHRSRARAVVTTTSPAPTTALPAEVPATSVAEGSSARTPPLTTPTTTVVVTTHPTTTAPPTTAPLAGGELIEALVALQLGDELAAGDLGEIEVPHLADIVAAEVGNDAPSVEDVLDVIERCLDGGDPRPPEECARGEAANSLDGP